MPPMPSKRSASTQSSPHGTPQKQARLSSFFTSPKLEQNGKGAAPSLLTQEEQDEEFARQLQKEWDEADATQRASENGDGRQASVDAPPIKKEESKSADDAHAPPAKAAASTSAGRFDWAALDASVASVDLQTDVFLFEPANVDTNAWPKRKTSDKTSLPAPSSEQGMIPSAPYALLAHACVLLSATRSRLAIVTILTNLLRTLMYHDPEALLPCIYLVSNHIAPPYDGIEMGLGGQICNKAIQNVTGKSNAQLRRWWNQTGDPGDVAFEAKKDVKTLVGAPRPIEITKLFSTLHTIAGISGTGSATAKMAHVTKLLAAARGEETRYLVRTFGSHLRINAVRTTITSAVARTFVLDGPPQRLSTAAEEIYGSESEREEAQRWCISQDERHGILANASSVKQRNDVRRLRAMDKVTRAERLLREVRARHPNFSSIVPALVVGGLAQLAQRVPLRVGTPLSPMLGSITRSLAAMFEKLGDRPFVSEFKYDGQRVQIHAQHVPVAGEDGGESTERVRQRAELMQMGGKGRWVGRNGDVYVRLFSRHLEDMTDKYPDITALVPYLMGVDQDEDVTASSWKVKEEEKEVESLEMIAEAPSSSRERPTVSSFIMDAEVVAMTLDGALQPFQTLTNRSRKDVELQNVKVAVGVFAFDLMQLNGQSLLKSSLRKRRSLMREYLPPCRTVDVRIARFDYVKSCMGNSMEEVSAFFDLARQNKCEGIMVKSLDHHWEVAVDGAQDGEEEKLKIELLSDEVDNEVSQPDLNETSIKDGSATETDGPGKGVNGRGKALLSTYEPDKRCESWLKVKKDYIEGIGDSLDLVPIAGWHGMGRKAAWWSPVLLAVYDAATDEYHAVCKCISGFTDAEYKSIKFERFAEGSATCYDARKYPPRHSFDSGGLLPDVWFEPCEVWEIRGADITLSPVYPAAKGLVSEERGLSLRFPRFMRRRTDKGPEQASTARQLANMYLEQNNTLAEGEGGPYDEEEDVEATAD